MSDFIDNALQWDGGGGSSSAPIRAVKKNTNTMKFSSDEDRKSYFRDMKVKSRAKRRESDILYDRSKDSLNPRSFAYKNGL